MTSKIRYARLAQLLCLLLSIFLLSRHAAAEEPGAEASPESAFTHLYERAVASYQAERYAAAVEDLLAAYQLQPEPRLLFNIAQSHRKMGDIRKAGQYFEQYLEVDKDISVGMK